MKFIPIEELRDTYVFDSRSNYSVPPAIEAFLETDGYEACIRRAISLGGDSDTIAAIAGGIAEAYYGEIPKEILDKGRFLLDSGLKSVLDEFSAKYCK
ncbi:MAG: ADP-ribosylglycohydrolase family protein [Lachnospiraceae bacterium]|nr:ADP-ribosylglycohydrolase family protein [Lachnospiraceae bacterium]